MTNIDDRRGQRVATVREELATLDGELIRREAGDLKTLPTGFGMLDEVLGGGLRAGELLVLAGPPGVGKTICALQWARNIARTGYRAVYVCYEHEPATLLTRLLALEAGELGGDRQVAAAISRSLGTDAEGDTGGRGLRDVLAATPSGLASLEAVEGYADNLVLVRASGARTTVDDLRDIVEPLVEPGRPTTVFVDYLQRLPVRHDTVDEAEKVTRTVEAMKDVALDFHAPVVLLSAVDGEGLRANRLRLQHLRGSTAIAFEADVVLMLNHKEKAVSKVHLSYDAIRARSYRDWLVASLEKNRGGPNLVDLEFRKDFSHFRLDPDGRMVAEALVSERLDESMI